MSTIRFSQLLLALLALLFCTSLAKLPLGQAQPTEDMRPTIYDDGLACPGNCDAHVVFSVQYNGTAHAFKPPLANRARPEKCVVGQQCMICFDKDDANCMTALYRGSGPDKGRFDFTPAFFREACVRPSLPRQLAAKCRAVEAAMLKLGYDRRINCFVAPDDAACVSIVRESERLRSEDRTERDACLREGLSRYNARQTDPSKQRSDACNYERFGTGGPNSKGERWSRLMAGTCRDGSYVGRDGLDCCSNDPFAAAAMHPECSMFFPSRRP
jgi:hypothetical protein